MRGEYISEVGEMRVNEGSVQDVRRNKERGSERNETRVLVGTEE